MPETGNVPLVCDMSSDICSKPVDVSKFGVIYAGAQKNLAPAGLTIVIVRKDLLGHAMPQTPMMLDWQIQAENDSMKNTPPCWCIYVLGLVCDWLQSLGGLEAMDKINQEKAKVLYDFLDRSEMFSGTVEKEIRSLMNVPFVTATAELDAQVVKAAKAAGFDNLKGHKSVGGLRASIYNAMPKEGVEALVAFLEKFEQEHK